MTALRQLLSNIVDYAGLFPPAGLPLPQVIKNYARYIHSENCWMLARVIVPAMKLPEFVDQYLHLFSEDDTDSNQTRWKISALIPAVDANDGGFAKAIEEILRFNQACPFAKVDTVEGKLPTPDLAAPTCEQLPDQLAAFLEIPFADPEPGIQAISHVQRNNTFGKIRTGGMTSDLIPSVECVARFIATSANHGLGFKATAGLHHPLRGKFGLTYEPDTECDVMHGFINVFLAACFARAKAWTAPQLIAVLQNTDASSIQISDEAITFNGNPLTSREIASVRKEFAISFGSCSFEEPIEDLTNLDWLAAASKTV